MSSAHGRESKKPPGRAHSESCGVQSSGLLLCAGGVGGIQPLMPAGEAGGCAPRSDRGGEIWELLGGVTLHQDVPVVEGVEINLDDICVGVVDPHALKRMGAD